MNESNSKPKATLSPEAQRLQRKIQKQWKIRDEPGISILWTAMRCWDQIHQAEEILQRDGLIVKDRFGQDRVHPAAQVLKESRAHFLQSVKALNLDLETLEKP
jgi:hypothetical protein